MRHTAQRKLKLEAKFDAGRSSRHLKAVLIAAPPVGMMHRESEVKMIAELLSPDILAWPDVLQERARKILRDVGPHSPRFVR